MHLFVYSESFLGEKLSQVPWPKSSGYECTHNLVKLSVHIKVGDAIMSTEIWFSSRELFRRSTHGGGREGLLCPV
jgi:hypothetical protein